MKKSLIALAAVAVSLTGCATVVSGTSQSLFIDTPHVEGASCKLADSKDGQWYLKDTPSSVTVSKGNGPMQITCNKAGYATTSVSVEEGFAGATLGNVILGGGIGIFVDAASGAAQRYPDKIVIWMKPKSWKSAAERKEWEAEKAKFEEEQRKKADESKNQQSTNTNH